MVSRICLIVTIFTIMGCQSTEKYGLFRPANDPLGAEVNQSFQNMIDGAWRGENVIGEVYFEYDKDDLTPATKQRLQEMVQVINLRTGQVIIAGHADHHNTNEYNKKLGYLRAIQVADYLKSAGVWDERMVIRSFGENRPTASNWNDPGQAKNRRVVISMFDQGEGMSGDEAIRVFNNYNDQEDGASQGGTSTDSMDAGGFGMSEHGEG